MTRRAACLSALLLLACDAGGLTQIIVVVDSDLDVPAELDSVRVEVTGMQTAQGGLSANFGLPQSVALVRRGGALGPIDVRVVGSRAGADVVEARAITSFVEGESVTLPMFLYRLCAGLDCGATETCTAAGVCAPAARDPETLGGFDGAVSRLDGGLTCEPITERCNGRDDDCDRAIDEAFDLTADPVNCGGCEVRCARPNALTRCEASVCVTSGCEEGFSDCDADAANGCEDDLSTTAHCGACGVACASPNAMSDCADGACVMGECLPGFDDCNGDPSDGCEVALNTLSDCGACGATCATPGATPSCGSGTCAIERCDVGVGDCNGDVGDGCEQALDTLEHCGGCGTPCGAANATPTCSGGACAIEACDALFEDCDGDATNGCEVPTDTLTDCGGCGAACSIVDGTPTCATGTCEVEDCDPDRGDCNDDPSDGCETNTRSDEMHCGTCDVVCMAPTDRCQNGTCR